MKLTKVQNRFIKNKNMGFSLMKGKSLTGKTITALQIAAVFEAQH